MLIKHFWNGKTITETEEKLKKYYGDSAPSHGMVYKWFMEFCCDHTSTTNAEHSGRPIEITTEEMVIIIPDIVLEDCCVKAHKIIKKVNISY